MRSMLALEPWSDWAPHGNAAAASRATGRASALGNDRFGTAKSTRRVESSTPEDRLTVPHPKVDDETGSLGTELDKGHGVAAAFVRRG
jgi:hypothetical protein